MGRLYQKNESGDSVIAVFESGRVTSGKRAADTNIYYNSIGQIYQRCSKTSSSLSTLLGFESDGAKPFGRRGRYPSVPLCGHMGQETSQQPEFQRGDHTVYPQQFQDPRRGGSAP